MAKRQHGVASVRQLQGPLGYSESAIGRAVGAGRLHRLHRGVYAVGHTDVSWQGRCLAAVLACGPKVLLSHRSAAWLWGISSRGPFPLQATTPVPRKARPPIAIHHARGLTAGDRGFEEGIPVTALPRTLLDFAVGARDPGHGCLLRAIELYREPVFTRSELERRFLTLVQCAGLSRPTTGFNVAGHELDVYWAGERFAVELDVFETHGTRAAFERDRLRQEDLMLEGVEVDRVTGKRLEREPDRVVERIARLLEQRRGGR